MCSLCTASKTDSPAAHLPGPPANRRPFRCFREGLARTLIVVWLTGASVAAASNFQAGATKSAPEQDLDALLVSIRERAESGDRAAQTLVGSLFLAAKRYPEAAMWFSKAASQGDPAGQAALGGLYWRGEGVPQSYPDALKWSLRAARQRNVIAQSNLAALYGEQNNDAESVRWARRAAERQCDAVLVEYCARARALLGSAYLVGHGVPQDYVLAYMWASVGAAALRQGELRQSAVRVRDTAASRMTPGQIAKAQRLARDWKPIAPK